MTWDIREYDGCIFVSAEDDGVYLKHSSYDLAYDHQELSCLSAPNCRQLSTLIPSMIELGYAEPFEKSIRIPYEKFVLMHEDDIHFFDECATYSPFYIELETRGTLGRDDFRYLVSFYDGMDRLTVERRGCFIRHLEKFYRLDSQTFNLIDQIDQFRKLTPDEKKSYGSYIRFDSIRDLAEGVGAQIDQYIRTNIILIPPKIGIDLIEESDGRISFAPFVEGVQKEDLRKVFLQSEDPTDLFVDDGKGGRIRLVFSYEQQEAIKRMCKVRHLGGKQKVNVLRNPESVFDGVSESIDYDIGDFGPRVKGIGDFPFIVNPVIRRSDTGIFEAQNSEEKGGDGSKGKKFDIGINCIYSDGTEDRVYFNNKNELKSFIAEVQESYKKGKGTAEFRGKSILLDKEFYYGVSELEEFISNKKTDKDKKYLLIHENDEQIQYEEDIFKTDVDGCYFSLPDSLKEDICLKPHQMDGLKWLQENYSLEGKKGCLLADDMGLGKTLQVLAFIAWLIEKGELTYESSQNPESAPWKPVLIVMPAILLENETWIQDMKRFFKNDGSIFYPYYVLHGKQLKSMRSPEIKGPELSMQKPILDLARLCQHRVILTNYETIVNYQFSFACMKSNWSLIVTDEAQAQKTPKTKISHALKSLSPKFRIACTGTPVETRLLDVWNIMDYLQPGKLLGSSSEFSKKYEQPINDNVDQLDQILESLRHRLHFGKPTSFIMRREKTQALKGLPIKIDRIVECDLSEEQIEKHMNIIERAKVGGKDNHRFALLSEFMKLYQYPLLNDLNHHQSLNYEQKIVLCPKLEKLICILDEIKQNGEKALIFTRSINMQHIIAEIIFERFRQKVDIINGASSKRETETAKDSRKAMLQRFRSEPKRNFIILSPEVAGVGITLVEANHVIHYGRWWNPAKESQATDRAYRIGQERDVNVYYLIAKDPLKRFVSFDEKLHNLIERRKKMANDFLTPMPTEKDLETELIKDVVDCPNDIIEFNRYICEQDLSPISWDRFEALIAVLEEKEGHYTILTPLTSDMGIDIVSIHNQRIRLIRCVKIMDSGDIDPNVMNDIKNASDTYKYRFLEGQFYDVTMVLVTNANAQSKIQKEFKKNGIDTIWATQLKDLLKKHKCTQSEIDVKNENRLKTMKNLKDVISDLIGEK